MAGLLVSIDRIEEIEPLAGGVMGVAEKLEVRPVGVDWLQEASAVLVHHLAERVTAELKLFRELTVTVVWGSEVPETFGPLREVDEAEIVKSGAAVTVTVAVASAGLAASLSTLTLAV